MVIQGCSSPYFPFTENLGVYHNKNKREPGTIDVYDCMTGKSKTLDVNELAAK